MELTDKITNALLEQLSAEFIHLDDDDGVSGYVVSTRFEKMSALDRQQLIDDALQNAEDPLSHEEQRRVLMIAGLTPLEYDSVGASIRVHRIRELGDGSLEILLHGNPSDALYVRNSLETNVQGVITTEPVQSPGAIGILMTFRAQGAAENPLTRETAMNALESDPYIEMLQNV